MKRKKKEAPEEFAAKVDEVEFKYGTEAADPKIPRDIGMERLCNNILDSFRSAVHWYQIEKVYQTDLKPVSALALSYLFPIIYDKRIKNVFLQVNNMEKDPDRRKVIKHIKHMKHFEYINGECVVDLNIMHGNKDPYRTLITAESEAWSTAARLLTINSDVDNNDMLWDLYKLLHYPSPFRLFITLSAQKYHANLLKNTSRLIKIYSKFITPGIIAAIQIPSAYLKKDSCTIACWQGKKLHQEPFMLTRTLL